MDMEKIQQKICRGFARLFEYPGPELFTQVATLSEDLSAAGSKASVPFATFRTYVNRNDKVRIEEAYTGTFDLQALCHPYIGYQLCGESQKRTLFMLKLAALYKEYDFVAGQELPDHLGQVLRFIGTIEDRKCRLEIVRDGLMPALAEMTQGVEERGRPYLSLLKTLEAWLAETYEIGQTAVESKKECVS